MGPGIQNMDLQILFDLGCISEMGGTDGAGIYQVKSNKYSQHASDRELTFKSWSTWSQMIKNELDPKTHKDLLNDCVVDLIMCHVRASTKGVISDSNAHPFIFPNLVGAHNGVLKDRKYLEHPTKTDSELLFKDISQRGIDKTLSELDRDSAYALTIYNKVDKKMYFMRNELRGLAFAFLEDRGVMYWATEMEMLKFVLNRHREPFKGFYLKPGVVLKVSAPDVTTYKIKDDPLKILQHHCKIKRELPTIIQKQEDARKAREEREALEKAQAEEKQQQLALVNLSQDKSNWTPDQYSFECKECGPTSEVKTVVSGGEVVSFPHQPTLGKFNISTKYAKCSCGSVNLSPLQQNVALRGRSNKFTFNHVTQTFHCEKCGVRTGEKAVG
ncbi:putative glutamine amidotransferase protein [Rhizobium phage RHph_N3_19]|nr:putative glutamine amidotransferase protein [Rhizobium phage RHph_N3_19]